MARSCAVCRTVHFGLEPPYTSEQLAPATQIKNLRPRNLATPGPQNAKRDSFEGRDALAKKGGFIRTLFSLNSFIRRGLFSFILSKKNSLMISMMIICAFSLEE
jgi:hypothetical protein